MGGRKVFHGDRSVGEVSQLKQPHFRVWGQWCWVQWWLTLRDLLFIACIVYFEITCFISCLEYEIPLSVIIKCNCFPPSAATATQRLSAPLHHQHPVLLLACGDICTDEVCSGKRNKQVYTCILPYLCTHFLSTVWQDWWEGECSCHRMTVMKWVWEIPVS